MLNFVFFVGNFAIFWKLFGDFGNFAIFWKLFGDFGNFAILKFGNLRAVDFFNY